MYCGMNKSGFPYGKNEEFNYRNIKIFVILILLQKNGLYCIKMPQNMIVNGSIVLIYSW